MHLRGRYVLAAVTALALVATTETSAFAWGCYAQARDGAYGISYNYPNKRSAVRRALNECRYRTYYRCRVIWCKPNG